MELSFSIIIPTYRRPDLLKKALASVVAQTYPHFECIVVNDDPSGHAATAEVLAGFKDSRLRLLTNESTGGAAVSRNRGIRESIGTWMAFLDDDDEWLSAKLEKHAQAHLTHPEVAVVYSGCIFRWTEGGLPDVAYPPEKLPPKDQLLTAMASGLFSPTSPTAFTARRDIFKQVHFDEQLTSLHDWDLWFQIARAFSDPFLPLNEVLAIYQLHVGASLSMTTSTRMKGLSQIQEKYGREYDVSGLLRVCRRQFSLHWATCAALKKQRLQALRLAAARIEKNSWVEDIRDLAKIGVLCMSLSCYRKLSSWKAAHRNSLS